MRIWDLAIRQPVFMTMILLAGLVLGGYSYTIIPVDLFPDVEFPVVVVTTVYPGADSTEIEATVTSILEEEFSGLPGINEVNSQTFEGLSNIILLFDLEKDVNDAAQEVQEKISLLRNRLPADVQSPIVQRFNPTDSPMMRFSVADIGGSMSSAELRRWVEGTIQIPLQSLDGVGAVDVIGGDVREIQVNLDRRAMEARRITAQQVVSALQTENLNIPGGSVTNQGQTLLVRTPGNFAEPQDLASVIVDQRGPAAVYLRDVARVVDGFEERDQITRLNGVESVSVVIRKRSGANTLRVTDAIKTTLAPIQEANPNINIVIADDQSIVVSESTNGAINDLLWGSVLAAFTILIFFRNLRNTFLTVIGLPIIMISTIFFLERMGISLNNVSLLALALVVGLVIDDGIVVRENILRWIDRGYKPMEAASKATAEVILPVIATTATILAVFLPVAYAEGIIGQFFKDFGFTVSIAIVISTFEALTLAPMMAAYFFKPGKRVLEGQIDETAGHEQAGTSWLDGLYGLLLNWALDHRWLTVAVALGIVGFSFYSARFINTAFVPTIDRGQFEVSMRLDPGTPLSTTAQEAIKVEEVIASHPQVQDIFTTIGSTTSPEQASFLVSVRDDGTNRNLSQQVIDDLRGPLMQVPGIAFAVAESGPGGGDAFIGGSRDIFVDMTSTREDFAELGARAEQFLADLEATVPGLVDTVTSYEAGKPELVIQVDRERASAVGLSTAQIGSTLRTLINGTVASTFRGVGEEADIVVRLQESDRANAQAILNVNLLSPGGRYIGLYTVAHGLESTGPTQITRRDRQPIVTIGMNVLGRDVPVVTTEVAAFLKSYPLPVGMSLKLGGDAEVQAESFQNLGAALLLAVIFIYMVLASQFGSFIQPILIMLAMPLSVIGALLALNLVGRPLDLTAFIGFIMLMGLVTKNSILLLDFANKSRAEGNSADLAMRIAGPVRLRPILMTAISLILAMIPIVIGISEGAEFRQSMSVVIMGGMITSTFLTLFVVPVVYSLVIGVQDRGKNVRRAHQKAVKTEFDLAPADNTGLMLIPAERKEMDMEFGPTTQ